jgi:hypothetical protein
MNYYTAIEQLRNDLLSNLSNYTPEQLKAGYERLLELTEEYLASN